MILSTVLSRSEDTISKEQQAKMKPAIFRHTPVQGNLTVLLDVDSCSHAKATCDSRCRSLSNSGREKLFTISNDYAISCLVYQLETRRAEASKYSVLAVIQLVHGCVVARNCYQVSEYWSMQNV
jgi:hypothetical protein